MQKECKKHGITDFVLRTDGRLRCKKCSSDSTTRQRKLAKLKAIAYKGGKCEKCGYDKCPGSLTFHHVNPTDKLFDIGAKLGIKSWKGIVEELDKCKLLCANCHLEYHWS
jgi:5-methylcytosine-specific restriction endonuclease McrA